MTLLHRLARYLEAQRVEGEIHRRLTRLDDRHLADIGLARGDIGRFARAAARPGVPLGVDAPRAGTAALVGRARGLRAA
jgi:uncharacterized protein YjiS (DUF1127 family)